MKQKKKKTTTQQQQQQHSRSVMNEELLAAIVEKEKKIRLRETHIKTRKIFRAVKLVDESQQLNEKQQYCEKDEPNKISLFVYVSLFIWAGIISKIVCAFHHLTRHQIQAYFI